MPSVLQRNSQFLSNVRPFSTTSKADFAADVLTSAMFWNAIDCERVVRKLSFSSSHCTENKTNKSRSSPSRRRLDFLLKSFAKSYLPWTVKGISSRLPSTAMEFHFSSHGLI